MPPRLGSYGCAYRYHHVYSRNFEDLFMDQPLADETPLNTLLFITLPHVALAD
jgi:hypothetical protein